MNKPCIRCGELTEESYCPEHIPKRIDTRTNRVRDERGRNGSWQKLSRKARSMQDWCKDCGSREDLTADHLPEAWHAFFSNRAITVHMVDVVCRSCNARRGESKPGSKRFTEWKESLTRMESNGETRGHFPLSEGVSAPGVSPKVSYSNAA